MTDHTLGPWRVRPVGDNVGIQVVGADNVILASIMRSGPDHGEADARLIAAAPEMYEALRAIIMGDHLSADEAYAMGSAALSKADGRF